MQNSLWKLTALMGVTALGFLIVLQVQHGMHGPSQGSEAEDVLAGYRPQETAKSTPSSDISVEPVPFPQEHDTGIAFGQSEPLPLADDRTAATHTSAHAPDSSTHSVRDVRSHERWPGTAVAQAAAQPPSPRPTPPEANLTAAEPGTFVPHPASRGLDFREHVSDPSDWPMQSDEPIAQVSQQSVGADRSHSNSLPVAQQRAVQPASEGTGTESQPDSEREASSAGQSDGAPGLLPLDTAGAHRAPVLRLASEPQTEAETTETTKTTETSTPPISLMSESPERPSPAEKKVPADASQATESFDPFKSDSPSASETAATTPEPLDVGPEASADKSIPDPQPSVDSVPTTDASGSDDGNSASSDRAASSESAKTVPDPKPHPLASPTEATDPNPLVVDDAGSSATVTDETELPARDSSSVAVREVPHGPQQPRLSIEKIAPANAILGKPMVYSIVIKNQGDSPAQDVLVEDRVPKGAELVGTIPQAQLDRNRLQWHIGQLPANQEQTISVKLIPKTEGPIGSVATVSFVAEVTAETRITHPDLHLEIAGPEKVKPGDRVSLQFLIRNDGTADATDVVLRDIIPEALAHPDGNDLEYDVGTLPAGESRTVQLTVSAKKAGKAVNKATLSADGDVVVRAEKQIEVIGEFFKVDASSPQRIYVGRKATYLITVTNLLEEPQSGITVRKAVPDGMRFVAASDHGRFAPEQQAVVWSLDSIPAGEKKTLSVQLTATQPGECTSRVSAEHAASGTRLHVESAAQAIAFASLTVETEGCERLWEPGEKATVAVKVRNRGPSPANNVRLRLIASGGVHIESARGPAKSTLSAESVEFVPLKTLAPQAEERFSFELQAVAEGNARIRIEIESDALSRPLIREEPLAVMTEP